MTEQEEQVRFITERLPDSGLSEDLKFLLSEIDSLRQTVEDWKLVTQTYQKERDEALDALSVTQEEWLLRVKHLERELYDAKK